MSWYKSIYKKMLAVGLDMLCPQITKIIVNDVFTGGNLERLLDKVYNDISEENAALTTIAEENLAGVRTIKAFVREKYEIQKFLSHNKRYYESNMREAKVMAKYDLYFSFVTHICP